ncbi:MAG TPA: tripartite tricarboxylate transporter substrate binding protein [Ramlibacter sp.]|nr:tripartite tricarboxylate transporter substrate binding protein [Ramlibacter sp.]
MRHTACRPPNRRTALRALAGCASLSALAGSPALAQDPYPNKSVRIVVPFAAGGAGDVVTRMVAQRLSVRLGQPFVVDNRPGAGGSIGPALVARAAPDGYTLAFISSGYTWLAATYPNLPFHPARELQPVALICSQPYAVIARKDAPFKTLRDFVAYARANPGKLNFASAGAGTLTHLLPAWLAAEAGISINHIPFGGTAPAMNSLVAGQTDVYFDPLSTSKAQLKAGTVQGLATTGSSRPPSFAELPTLAELGFQARGATWFGFMAPAGVPKALVEKLHQEINAVLAEDEIRQKLVAMEFVIEATTVAKFAAFLEQQTATWGKVIKDNNIKAD